VLVPYDVAPNYQPGLLGGKKPHWVLVKGFFLLFPSETNNQLKEFVKRDHFNLQNSQSTPISIIRIQPQEYSLQIDNIQNGPTDKNGVSILIVCRRTGEQCRFYALPENVLLICQHAKTRFQSIYWLPLLFASNFNLMSFPTEKFPELIVPAHDSLGGLRGQAVHLTCSFKSNNCSSTEYLQNNKT
jgi:hypothetical protein